VKICAFGLLSLYLYRANEINELKLKVQSETTLCTVSKFLSHKYYNVCGNNVANEIYTTLRNLYSPEVAKFLQELDDEVEDEMDLMFGKE
jgi:hypothetical protein